MIEIQGVRETGRQGDRETERQGDSGTERQRDRETVREGTTARMPVHGIATSPAEV